MSGSGMDNGERTSEDDCMQWCHSVTGCRSIDYNVNNYRCFLYNATVLDVPPSDWLPGLSTANHYQKMFA